jgi:aryl-alcohol dehydrogenase-like predicted oxidoreductase
MEQRTLGRTGLHVSALGFGGAEISRMKMDPAAVRRLMDEVLDCGLTMIDTAECYVFEGSLPCEELLGHALDGRRDKVVISTKCGHATDLPYADWTPELIVASVDRSLKRLRTDHVDILHLHTCDEATLRRADDAIAAMQAVRDAGKTRLIGYAGDAPAMVYAIESGAFDAMITSVNVMDQEAIDLTIPMAVERGMGVIAKRAVANAVWTYGDTAPTSSYHYPYWERLRKLQYPFLNTGEAFSTTLRFALSVPGVDTALVGCAVAEQWRQNAAAVARGPLSDEEFKAIRDRWMEVAGADWGGKD